MTALGPAHRLHSLRSRPVRSEADEELSRDYERLKPEILRTVRRKLRPAGVIFDDADLESFYNQAWHAVYLKLAAGDEVDNRTGLLVSIAHRRALDEHRSLRLERRADSGELDRSSLDPDLAAQLDDSARLRRLREGMRDRLEGRELEAAALCYVHDYSRAAAARVLGIRPKRMQKLMDGVSKKFALLVDDLDRTDWCNSRKSLIKAYALGLLDSTGRRHELATEHLRECPACRRRVLALRGLAAAAPPAPFIAGLLAGAERTGTAAAALGLVDTVGTDRRSALARAAAAVVASAAIGSVGTFTVLDREPSQRRSPPAAALLEATPKPPPRPTPTPSPSTGAPQRKHDESRRRARDRRSAKKARADKRRALAARQAATASQTAGSPQRAAPPPTAPPPPSAVTPPAVPAEEPPLRDGWQEFELG